MTTQLVPYNNAMQLGSGFNSFTQTLCVDHAVVGDPDMLAAEKQAASTESQVAQSVTYKTSIINKTTDVTDELNINGAFDIKFGGLGMKGSGSYINTDKIKDSDVSIMVSVKVVNQTIYDHSLVKFQPISNIKDASPQKLNEVYGDAFISGWQEGGEFLAVISIKAKNRDEASNIKADAEVAFSRNKDPPAEIKEQGLDVKVSGRLEKIKRDLISENEVSVSVTWTGGGQHLKAPEQDWDFDTIKDVGLKFPDLCAKTPMRTHALITKYTALRSFYTTQNFQLPAYDKTGTYTNILQEAFLDYKAVLSTIQVLAFDVSEGTKALIINPRAAKSLEQSKVAVDKATTADGENLHQEHAAADSASSDSELEVVRGTKSTPKVTTFPPPLIDEPFAASIEGLEEARFKCRFMMSRISQEIDNIALNPDIATDEKRRTPYLSPFSFKLLLPLGVQLPAEASPAAQAMTAAKVQPDALATRFSSIAT